MKIGVVSEGATEEGRIRLQDELRPIQERFMGALHVLVRRIAREKGLPDPEFVAPPRTRRLGKGGLMKELPRILAAYDEKGIFERRGRQIKEKPGDAVSTAFHRA